MILIFSVQSWNKCCPSPFVYVYIIMMFDGFNDLSQKMAVVLWFAILFVLNSSTNSTSIVAKLGDCHINWQNRLTIFRTSLVGQWMLVMYIIFHMYDTILSFVFWLPQQVPYNCMQHFFVGNQLCLGGSIIFVHKPPLASVLMWNVLMIRYSIHFHAIVRNNG